MRDAYPEIEPYEHGRLDVGDGNLVYWETCGNPDGKPAVVLHGGPGSGCSPWWRTLFDPSAYRIVLFDQRNSGRSTPHASEPDIDLTSNTTANLIADIEQLREHLDIDRWLVLGASWGSTLALAYAVTHPDRISEMVLFGVTTGRHSEMDWTFRGGNAVFFPEQWDRLLAGLPADQRNGDVVAAYSRLLHDPNPAIRLKATEDWCLWESATPNWPPATGHRPNRQIHRPRLRAGVRAHRHPLHSAQLLARRREPARQRGSTDRHTRSPGERTLRFPSTHRQRLGAQARVATRRARDRRRRRPLWQRGAVRRGGSRHRPTRARLSLRSTPGEAWCASCAHHATCRHQLRAGCQDSSGEQALGVTFGYPRRGVAVWFFSSLQVFFPPRRYPRYPV